MRDWDIFGPGAATDNIHRQECLTPLLQNYYTNQPLIAFIYSGKEWTTVFFHKPDTWNTILYIILCRYDIMLHCQILYFEAISYKHSIVGYKMYNLIPVRTIVKCKNINLRCTIGTVIITNCSDYPEFYLGRYI